jgi:serine/threonine protein phosphatase PrpC
MMIDTAALSKPGGRRNNQDAYGYEATPLYGCWVVADGLGGHAGGETASRMAVDAVLSMFQQAETVSPKVIDAGFLQAHQAIRQKAAEDFALSAMRTTLTVLICDEQQAMWGHVGDSRLYWFRNGKILYQTKDHSVPQMLVDAGKITPAEVRGHEEQNRLTRAVGQEGVLRATILSEPVPLQLGDAALLCSDGIWNYILETEMEDDWAAANSATEYLDLLERRVLARASGEHDNYTAVAVRFQGVVNHDKN